MGKGRVYCSIYVYVLIDSLVEFGLDVLYKVYYYSNVFIYVYKYVKFNFLDF